MVLRANPRQAGLKLQRGRLVLESVPGEFEERVEDRMLADDPLRHLAIRVQVLGRDLSTVQDFPSTSSSTRLSSPSSVTGQIPRSLGSLMRSSSLSAGSDAAPLSGPSRRYILPRCAEDSRCGQSRPHIT